MVRERKPLKIPYNINFIASDNFDLKVSIIKDISRFIRENQGRQIKITIEAK